MAHTGGALIVDVLRQQGVDRIFGVPGESFLAVLDALVDHDDINMVITKHEGAAAMMADADGKLTGRPGIAMVTRGPGVSNAFSGIHVAYQDSTPMIVFVGLIARGDVEREAFQEIDLKAVFGTQAKWVTTINDAARIPELVSRAFATAMNGRPGPVVIGLPEDMLRDRVENTLTLPARIEPTRGGVSLVDVEAITSCLEVAERPLLIVGGEGWTTHAVSDLESFAKAWNLPVSVSFRAQDRMSPDSENYVGDSGLGINPKLAARIKEADLLLVFGARLGDCTTSSYTLIDIPVPKQKLIFAHASAEEIGRVYAPELGLNCGMSSLMDVLKNTKPKSSISWSDWRAAAREDYLNWTAPTSSEGPLNMAEVMCYLRENLPEEAILTNGAGNYAIWLHRFYRYRNYRTQLAPTSGSMGYGLPAAIAAKLRHPDRPVICFAGDGCFQMAVQELATIKQQNLPVMTIVSNNGMYGTIRMHQEKNYPTRTSGTDIVNPDFVILANAYGLEARRVSSTEEFIAAYDDLSRMNTACLIELVMDQEDLTPNQTLSAMQQQALSNS